MDDQEREELLADVGNVVASKLQLHHKANGYVSKPTFDGAVQVLTQTMGQVTDAVENVNREVVHQRQATEGLKDVTSQLCTDLAEHKAEHRGAEKAKNSVRMKVAADVAEKSSNWKRNGVIVALVVGGLGLLGGFSAWFVIRTEAAMKAAHDRPPVQVLIDKKAAAEIAKAIHDD